MPSRLDVNVVGSDGTVRTTNIRKRKTHNKSRRGCGNCKIRRVKCDETHPKCHKCIAYGVSCDFSAVSKDASVIHASSETLLDFSDDAPFQVVEFSLSDTRKGSISDSSISNPSLVSSSSGIDSDSDTSSQREMVLLPHKTTTLNQNRPQYPNHQNLWIESEWYGPQKRNANHCYFPAPSLRLTSPSASYTLLAMFDFESNTFQSGPTSVNQKKFQPTLNTLHILDRFQSRTAMTIGSSKNWEAFRQELMNLVWTNEHVLHVVLTLTLKHDSFLTTRTFPSISDRAKSEREAQAFHWYKGTYLFNRILSRAITARSNLESKTAATEGSSLQVNEDELFYTKFRPSLWPCAALLGAVAFNDVDADRSTDSLWNVWPLRSSFGSFQDEIYDNDLEWLKLSEGKHVVWQLATPLGSDTPLGSAPPEEPEFVRNLMDEIQHDLQLVKEGRFGLREVQDLNDRLPEGLASLFFSSAILSSSTTFTFESMQSSRTTRRSDSLMNPHYLMDCSDRSDSKDEISAYLPSLIILSYILNHMCTHSSVLVFLNFIYQFSPTFISFLRQKDPRAMFLLTLWYTKMAEYGAWWVLDRAVREGQAICLWLELMANREDIALDEPDISVSNKSEPSGRTPTQKQITWSRQIVTTQASLLSWVKARCL